MPEDHQEAIDPANIFRAYQGKGVRSRGLRPYLVALVVLLGLGTLGWRFVSHHSADRHIRVETPWGMRTVRQGMSPADVRPIMGAPATREVRGNQECFQHGRPTIELPSFTLYTLCYEDGALRDVTERRYNAWVVSPDGAIAPAPLERPASEAPSLAREASAP
jgi:hypothetical protein